MFLLIPWRVDVPQDRWPVMNWLILLALVAVFTLQIGDYLAYLDQHDASLQRNSSRSGTRTGPGAGRPGVSQGIAPGPPTAEQRPQSMSEAPGITRDLILRGWSLKGLLGYMWLHAGPLHLSGNMLFLWIFGNALCAKLGNLKYLGLYVLFGVAAGMAQLLCRAVPALGASGAINGVVGAYLVLFFENEITCLFVFWPLVFLYVRWFAVSSVWMVLFWLSWDIVGAMWGRSNVGHAAHLGGFAAGFGITLLMCHKGWIVMEKYEKSLLQMWQERRRGLPRESRDAAYAQLGLHLTKEELPPEDSPATVAPEPAALRPATFESEPTSLFLGTDGFIRTACACGHAIRVRCQYAGRTVRCPRCRHPVVIPDKTDFFGPAPSLPPVASSPPNEARTTCIRFVCMCGKKIKASAQHAGRNVKCPHCGARLKIPTILP